MAQDANEWNRYLTRANQLFRATTHPAVVQLPVEGSLPSLAAAVVDRLTFNAHIIQTGTQSYRLRATTARKKGAATS